MTHRTKQENTIIHRCNKYRIDYNWWGHWHSFKVLPTQKTPMSCQRKEQLTEQRPSKRKSVIRNRRKCGVSPSRTWWKEWASPLGYSCWGGKPERNPKKCQITWPEEYLLLICTWCVILNKVKVMKVIKKEETSPDWSHLPANSTCQQTKTKDTFNLS